MDGGWPRGTRRESRRGGGAFCQQRVVCGWEVLVTEEVLCLFDSGQPLPSGNTLPGSERSSRGWITGCTSVTFLQCGQIKRRTVKWLLFLDCECSVLTSRTWSVRKKWTAPEQNILTASLREWETTRSPSWPIGGRNPERSGTPERWRSDVCPLPTPVPSHTPKDVDLCRQTFLTLKQRKHNFYSAEE